MYRVEDKYALPDEDFMLMRKRMETILQSDSNSLGDKEYKISSLYFDDIYDTHYQDTVDGVPYRNKYRIRIYNDSFDTIKLEVKTKQYNRIGKRAVDITYKQMQELMQGELLEWPDDCDDPRAAFNLAIRAENLKPKVIVTYERKAFIYPSGNVRITFDRNIRGSNRIEAFGNADLVYDYPVESENVLEVKYDEFLPDFIAQALETDSMCQTSNSKYRICREIYKR